MGLGSRQAKEEPCGPSFKRPFLYQVADASFMMVGPLWPPEVRIFDRVNSNKSCDRVVCFTMEGRKFGGVLLNIWNAGKFVAHIYSLITRQERHTCPIKYDWSRLRILRLLQATEFSKVIDDWNHQKAPKARGRLQNGDISNDMSDQHPILNELHRCLTFV